MANQEQSDFYIVFTKVHCVLQPQKTLIIFLFETAQVLNQLPMRAITFEGNLKVTGKFEFHISPNKKLASQRIMGKLHNCQTSPGPPSLA